MSKIVTREEFIERCNKVHNNKYDYSKVSFKTLQDKVTIICPIHGEFEQKAANHMRGDGCPSCSGNKKLNNEEFIKRAREVHKDKYDYSKVNYKNCEEKVEIICPIHGSFWQSFRHHVMRGHGCPECNGGVLQTKEEFIRKAIAIHGDKYDYSRVVYINAITPVEIICKTHNKSFWQTPHTHITGKGGCPECAGVGSSKLEIEVENYLILNNIKYEKEKVWDWLVYIKKQRVDYYLPEFNVIIECQGLQHFEEIDYFGSLEERLNRDDNKEKLCSDHGIKIYYYSNIRKTYRSDYIYPYQVFEDLDELMNCIRNENPTSI